MVSLRLTYTSLNMRSRSHPFPASLAGWFGNYEKVMQTIPALPKGTPFADLLEREIEIQV